MMKIPGNNGNGTRETWEMVARLGEGKPSPGRKRSPGNSA